MNSDKGATAEEMADSLIKQLPYRTKTEGGVAGFRENLRVAFLGYGDSRAREAREGAALMLEDKAREAQSMAQASGGHDVDSGAELLQQSRLLMSAAKIVRAFGETK